MAPSGPTSEQSSHETTPNRFTAQAETAEDFLKSQIVGLVQLSEFRKRRAEASEQKGRDSPAAIGGGFTPSSNKQSGMANPIGAQSDGTATSEAQRPKKRKRAIVKGKLSFGDDDERSEEANGSTEHIRPNSGVSSAAPSARASPAPGPKDGPAMENKRLGANNTLSLAPRVMTKPALLKEAQTREQLRKEFLIMQEAVKATEIVIPFVFYDGTNIPGGACKIKKGEHVWLFLDRSRKVGAELGVGGSGKGTSRREWARISVDDLMLVRGGIIIPHHYEIHYFIVNKTQGSNGRLLFDFAATTDLSRVHSPASGNEEGLGLLNVPGKTKSRDLGKLTPGDNDLEGAKDDPTFTKVVDRRWYERNKHIFPSSTWEEFDTGKDYSTSIRKDAQGNAFFF